MRFEVDEDARNAARFQVFRQRRRDLGEVAQNRLVSGVTAVAGDEPLHLLFVLAAALIFDDGLDVILDMQPTEPRLHRLVLLVNFGGRIPLNDEVRRVEDQLHRRMVDLTVNFRQNPAVATDKVRLDFQPERQVGAMARLGDLAQTVDRLRNILFRVVPLRLVERKTANQLRFEEVRDVANALHVLFQIFVERNITVVRAVLDVEQFHLSDRRPDRRNVQAVIVLHFDHAANFVGRQRHHVLHAVAEVHKADAIILQAERREGRKLLDERLFVGAFVGEPGQNHLRFQRFLNRHRVRLPSRFRF